MTLQPQARHCSRCGVRLARDNHRAMCGACQTTARDALLRPPVVPAEFWLVDQMRDALATWHMGRVIFAYRTHPFHGRTLRQELVGNWLGLTQAQLSRMENGHAPEELGKLVRHAQILGVPAELLWFKLPETAHAKAEETPRAVPTRVGQFIPDGEADEAAALELARRVAASDVGDETLCQLERVVDDFAVQYSATPPQELLGDIRRYLSYVGKLVDGRKTLEEHRRLLVVGAWLSLLAATMHIDLKQPSAASARLRTAAGLARHGEHEEIRAWCLETEAWRVLTDGDYPRAVDLSRAAQEIAPRGSSAAIQAIAQEGRAWARLGQPKETYTAISRVGTLVAPLARPDRPEHHYLYDPDKYTAYTATTLAWVGDPAAEGYAREIITRMTSADQMGKRPRRLASAKLDLALALLITNRFDEACAAAYEAIASGRVVPSNHWRALEVVRAAESRKLPEASDLREAYQALKKAV